MTRAAPRRPAAPRIALALAGGGPLGAISEIGALAPKLRRHGISPREHALQRPALVRPRGSATRPSLALARCAMDDVAPLATDPRPA